jgi:enoyl-CoA hydratase/carnithine racemase
MSGDAIQVVQEGRVRRVRLTRPERRNALDAATARSLAEALRQADLDPGTGAVVLEGDGPDFCAGADIREFTTYRGRSGPTVWAEGEALVELMRVAEHLRTPLVAAVHGHALGGGLGLVAMSHLAVGADSCQLGATEIRLGLFPLAILPALVRAVGPRRALELGLTGRVFGAAEALSLGVLTEVVPAAEVHGRAGDLAASIAARSPAAIAAGLTAHRLAVGTSDLDSMNLLRAVVFLSDDLKEGATAFLERRPPVWTGR